MRLRKRTIAAVILWLVPLAATVWIGVVASYWPWNATYHREYREMHAYLAAVSDAAYRGDLLHTAVITRDAHLSKVQFRPGHTCWIAMFADGSCYGLARGPGGLFGPGDFMSRRGSWKRADGGAVVCRFDGEPSTRFPFAELRVPVTAAELGISTREWMDAQLKGAE